MTRSFAFAIGDQVNKSGMQIIGWDPVAKQIHSWVFDSDGGYGEGTWTHKGRQVVHPEQRYAAGRRQNVQSQYYDLNRRQLVQMGIGATVI